MSPKTTKIILHWNGIQYHAPPNDPYHCLVNFDIIHLFLPLNFRMILVLLTMFDWLTCLVYYIECLVSFYLGYSAHEGIGLILIKQTFILLLPVGYLGMIVSCASLSQWSTLLFLLYTNVQKHYTTYCLLVPHSFSLVIFTFSIMYMAWCLTYTIFLSDITYSQYIIIVAWYHCAYNDILNTIDNM